MKNRGLIARQLAKVKKVKKPKTKKGDPLKEIQQILGRDPETGEVTIVFNDFDEAVVQEFNKPNIKSSIKTGNKYKGLLWELSKVG